MSTTGQQALRNQKSSSLLDSIQPMQARAQLLSPAIRSSGLRDSVLLSSSSTIEGLCSASSTCFQDSCTRTQNHQSLSNAAVVPRQLASVRCATQSSLRSLNPAYCLQLTTALLRDDRNNIRSRRLPFAWFADLQSALSRYLQYQLRPSLARVDRVAAK